MAQSSIAHYRVTSKLGAGGMGEVWGATDTKLNRDVAVKILPDVFARDAERMARFTREAQVLASLNHPNIAAIYGLEESSGVRALVMELVDGPALADRIVQGSNRDGRFNIYVGLVRGGELVQVTHGDSLKSRPSWSPGGSRLAYGQINDSGSVDVWEVSALGGSPRKVLLDANDATWAPDGRSLIYENIMDGSIWTSGVSGENAH